MTRLFFKLHSPLTLGFTDTQGNYTGSTPTTTLFTIPGVDYERFGEVQWLSIPQSMKGQVTMHGAGTGSFALDIESVNGNTVLATTTFAAVPSATSTIATLNIDPTVSPTASSTLSVDFNGDGIVDTTLSAKEGRVVVPKVPLTVTATNQTIVIHSHVLPPLTAVLSGFVNGDTTTDSAVSGAPTCTTTATVNSPVGTYPITCTVGTLSSNKYSFETFVAGTLSVQYRCDTFLDPINNKGHEVQDKDDEKGEKEDIKNNPSVFKFGSTVPVKFQFLDANNLVLSATTVPLWLLPQNGQLCSVTVGIR
jgi:hypothetical protein